MSNDDSAFDPNNPFASLGSGAVLTPAAGVITPTASHHHVAAGTVSSIAVTNVNTAGHALLLLTADGAITITLGATIIGTTTSLSANDQLLYLYDTASTAWREITVITAWHTPTFAAGSYTSDVGTWVVASGDVATLRYVVVGKRMTLVFWIDTATTTSTPGSLRLAIPGGFTGAVATMVTSIYLNENGTITTGTAQITGAGATYLTINKLSGAAFANLTDTLSVRGEITFEIQ